MSGATRLQVSLDIYIAHYYLHQRMWWRLHNLLLSDYFKNSLSVFTCYHVWFVEKTAMGGLARTARARTGGGSLTFLQVFEAGHMVPMDQPAAALEMLKVFTANKAFY